MNLHRMLLERAATGRPLGVALIGAGKFGSMYLAQARHTPAAGPIGWRISASEPASTTARGRWGHWN